MLLINLMLKESSLTKNFILGMIFSFTGLRKNGVLTFSTSRPKRLFLAISFLSLIPNKKTKLFKYLKTNLNLNNQILLLLIKLLVGSNKNFLSKLHNSTTILRLLYNNTSLSSNIYNLKRALIAQLDRASVCGTEGWRFKSSWAHPPQSH